RIETNDHLWKCEKAVPAVNDITSNFHQKYRIPDRSRNCTMLALRGIVTMNLTSKIAAHLKTTQDDPISADEMREKITKAYLGLVTRGRKEVWLPRNEAAILYQKHILNISAKDKHEPSQPSGHSAASLSPSRTMTIQPETELLTVLVATSDLNWRYNVYRCNCGQHSAAPHT